ncbi:hypothetical protein QEP13_09205 [Enterobacter ludwigii]|uniref:hypothetical protein n=1 Tax=Enterobacter TaxID=547 RepID=UPI001F50DFEB|nr:hypothetical protein [Enterobacter cloacae]
MNITAKNKIFYFWGIMDVIGIVFYSIGPYHLLQSWWDSTGGNFGVIIFMLIAGGVNGLLAGLFYLVYLLWPVSLCFSAWFFFHNAPICRPVCSGAGSTAPAHHELFGDLVPDDYSRSWNECYPSQYHAVCFF